jgi:hypothetical protein
MVEKAGAPGLGELGHGEIDAATRLDLVGSDLTAEAARTIVEEDLAPVFLKD